MTEEEVVTMVEAIGQRVKRFKIGKTGQALEERFDSEYSELYDNIRQICASDDKKAIDDLERRLIVYFTTRSPSRNKCDNDQEGGGEMGKAEKYLIYVVYKM